MPAPYRQACANCVKSKRRCDLVLPRCYRCRVRSLDCSYHNASPFIQTRQQSVSSRAVTILEPVPSPASQDETPRVDTHDDQVMQSAGSNIDFNQLEVTLPPFPDYDLDWSDVMGNIESFWVPDQLQSKDSPMKGVLAGDIYQERIIYSVKKVKAYPSLLVSQGSTPFIHRKLYAEYMPPAIQDVLGICALYGQKTERNQDLVFRTISLKAAQLIAGYTPQGLSPVEQLAYTQALIIYQIIRLFDGDIRLRADAERTDPTLKEWTQDLKSRMLRINFVSDDEQALLAPCMDMTWQNWVFAESLRRTVIISISVQGLYCFLKNGWDESHVEINPLSFYAQRALWDAPSEYNWRSAGKEHNPLPIRFSSWNADMTHAKPSDMDDLGIMMMALMKGVDECCQWVGDQHVAKFGLLLHENK